MVKRIRSCKVTEYYEIMSLKRDCEEAEVKKAYRKVCVVESPPVGECEAKPSANLRFWVVGVVITS